MSDPFTGAFHFVERPRDNFVSVITYVIASINARSRITYSIADTGDSFWLL